MQTPTTFRPLFQFSVTVLASALLAACGGGSSGGESSPDVTVVSSASKSVATGTVSGFGSIIVNGVRYELSDTKLTDDDSGAATITCSDNSSNCNSGIKLGMEVEIEAGQITRRADDSSATPSSTASRINFGASLLGPVGILGTDQWTVLGQTVNLTSTTVVSGTAAAGSVVEVHGLLDKTTGVITATRIEVKSSSVPAYRLRGQVTGIDTAAGTALLGGQLVSFAGLTNGLTGLVNGQYIRAKLATTKNGAGAWVAQSIKSNERKLGSDDNGSHSELEGLIGVVALATDGSISFQLNGSSVNVPTTGVTYERGVMADLKAGARVEIEGTVVDGMLQATKVEFKLGLKPSQRAKAEDDSKKAGTVDDRIAGNQTELHGLITSLDATTKTFVIRDVKVDYSDMTAVSFPKGGSLADLAAWATGNRQIEAKGYLMADGVTVKLVRIKLDSK